MVAVPPIPTGIPPGIPLCSSGKLVTIVLLYKSSPPLPPVPITGATVKFKYLSWLLQDITVNASIDPSGTVYYACIPTGLAVRVYASKSGIDFGNGESAEHQVNSVTIIGRGLSDYPFPPYLARTEVPCPSSIPSVYPSLTGFGSLLTTPKIDAGVISANFAGYDIPVAGAQFKVYVKDTEIGSGATTNLGALSWQSPTPLSGLPIRIEDMGKPAEIKIIINFGRCVITVKQTISLPAPPVLPGLPITCADLEAAADSVNFPSGKTLPSTPSTPFFISVNKVRLKCPSTGATDLVESKDNIIGTVKLGSMSPISFPIPSPNQSKGDVYFDLSRLITGGIVLSQITSGIPATQTTVPLIIKISPPSAKEWIYTENISLPEVTLPLPAVTFPTIAPVVTPTPTPLAPPPTILTPTIPFPSGMSACSNYITGLDLTKSFLRSAYHAYIEYQKPVYQRATASSTERDLIEALAMRYYDNVIRGGVPYTYESGHPVSTVISYNNCIVQIALTIPLTLAPLPTVAPAPIVTPTLPADTPAQLTQILPSPTQTCAQALADNATIIQQYIVNNRIAKAQAVQAILDYFDGKITKQQAIAIINFYYGSCIFTPCPDFRTTVESVNHDSSLPSTPSTPFFISINKIKSECPSNSALTKKMTGETGTVTLGNLSPVSFPIPSPSQSDGEVYFDLAQLIDLSRFVGGTPLPKFAPR